MPPSPPPDKLRPRIVRRAASTHGRNRAASAAPLPREQGAPRPPPRGPSPEVHLRLTIGPAGLGLELAEPVRVGCARVTGLTVSLPGARFPVDVSGGVARFRHRRGELRFVEVELSAPALERWAAPRLRGIVGSSTPDVWVQVRRDAATFCVSEGVEPDAPAPTPSPVVAFDVHLAAEGEDLILVVAGARGAGLPAPAPAVAIACAEALMGGLAERSGSIFVLRKAAGALARTLLPEAGARAPSSDEVRWSALGADTTSWILQAARGETGAAPAERSLREREVATTLRAADEALLGGALDDARQQTLLALEHAPRHPEIVRRLVEIDARVPGRAEAALATLGELREADRAAPFGVVPGMLLLERGDRDAAIASLEAAADREVAPALAAKELETAAHASPDREAALALLDRALARAPRSSTARWARVERRLAMGRLEEACSDAEHLEALAGGPRAKHEVWMRAGRLWRGAGLAGQAAPVFERALRFVPDEPGALGGLGAALLAEGQLARGTALLARALELAEQACAPTGGLALDLAVALAERLDDLPSGIARAAAIPGDSPEAVLARGLEGRWRARLGDHVGAGLAFAKMRDRLASHTSLGPVDVLGAGPSAMDLLVEAAHFETGVRRDPAAAQRYLAEALRLRPHDEALRAAYRAACAELLGGAPREVAAPPIEARAETMEPEARAEQLTRRVHADPADDAAADELAGLLEQLDRGHELLALLSGRLEDAGPERRVVLVPRARAALERLAAQASRDGRDAEAELFRTSAASLV